MSCRRCQRAEVLGVSAPLYRWPEGTVVAWYLYRETVPAGLGVDIVERAIADAAFAWASACGVVFARVASPEQARILVYFGQSIDGPWGILGQTELPIGDATARHRMEFDPAEAWTPAMFRLTALHELGHGIGVEHSPAGVVAVMAPLLDMSLADEGLQPWDKSEGVARYGQTAASPKSPAPTATIDVDPFTFTFRVPSGERYAVTFTPTEARRLPDAPDLASQALDLRAGRGLPGPRPLQPDGHPRPRRRR